MKMARNSWRLAFTLVGVQVAIMVIVVAAFSVMSPKSQSGLVVFVSVLLGGIANVFVQKKLAV